jgi:serine/threonine protein kinase
MQPERVERVKHLLASALARPPAEREAFLDSACAGDTELRREVALYLHSGDKTEQFTYNPARETVFDPPSNASPLFSNESVEHQVPDTEDGWIGKEFGKYKIEKRLAEGGMGIVYLANDSQLGRDVALKILPRFFSMDKERLQRFHREARATSLLNHPNIVTVFELGQMDGCEFIVTEYVEGETLRTKMENGPIPFVEILKIMSQVAGALGTAHKAGIIHRDIKPENIMIRPDGYVKVLDFGLAKLTGSTSSRVSGGGSQASFTHTVPGMIMGTVSYMSPEQTEGLDVDARTDIWGLGVILYEMVAGKLPFEGPTQSHTIVAILEQEPQPFEHPSAELKQVITTALQKDRTLRFQTAEAMEAALDGLKHRLGYISDQNVKGHSVELKKEAKPRSPAVRKLAWIVPLVAIVIFGGAIAIFAAIAIMWNSGSGSNSNGSANIVAPTATITPQQNSPVPTPTAMPTATAPVFVAPTTEPTAEPAQTPRVDRPRATPVPTPARTPVRVEPRKTPVRKPKQDPNCVFTNTCT